MGRLIDADVIIDEIKKDTEKVIAQDDKVGSFWLGYIAGLVIRQPSVQQEPTDEQVAEYCKRRCLHIVTNDFFRIAQPERAEGEWINTNHEYKNRFYDNSYYCSECHDYYTTSPYAMNYCPKCGAKMKVRQNG